MTNSENDKHNPVSHGFSELAILLAVAASLTTLHAHPVDLVNRDLVASLARAIKHAPGQA